MRKIRLEVEHLGVESFVTAAESRSLGTVWGNGVQIGGFAQTQPQPADTPDCSADTVCDTRRYSCIDSCTPQPTCDSCFVTRCRTNGA